MIIITTTVVILTTVIAIRSLTAMEFDDDGHNITNNDDNLIQNKMDGKESENSQKLLKDVSGS